MGRLFWKFFFFFWLAQVVTSLGVGGAIWFLHRQHDGPPPPPPPPHEFRQLPDAERPPPAPPPPVRGPVMAIVAGSAVSLVFAALLAWYFARPIRTLRGAFEATASGRLETRIGPGMGARRDELADLGSDFDRMAERLQGLIEGQRHLLHDVSHELRSPLARLQAIADLMRQQPERAPEFVDRVERDIARMDRLVGELLTLARLDAGGYDAARERISLPEFITAIADEARIEVEARGCRIALDLALAVHVEANRDLLRRALENVLRNALRHSPAGGSIDVGVRNDSGQAVIEIADQGGGVPAHDLEAIFEPFYRSANTDAFAGYGLGLAIVRRVVQFHGGTVRAANRAGGGFVVTLKLPGTA